VIFKVAPNKEATWQAKLSSIGKVDGLGPSDREITLTCTGQCDRHPAPKGGHEIEENKKQHHTWFELMKLVHRCPSTVNGISIMGPTRLTLWSLAYHADSETASTTVNVHTLAREVGCSRDSLDRAVQNLISAGLVSQSVKLDHGRIVTDRCAINRDLLRKEVAAAAYLASLGDLAEQDYTSFYGPVPRSDGLA
jgi:hypothetical protein